MDDAQYPGELLFQACLYNNHDLLEDALQGVEKANINAVDSLGRSVVYTAVTNNTVSCLRVLLKYKANPDVVCKKYNGMTALHQAAADGHADLIKVLLEYQANSSIKDKDQKTPLDLANSNHHKSCIRLLQNAKDTQDGFLSGELRTELANIDDCSIEKCDKYAVILEKEKVELIVNEEIKNERVSVLTKACKTIRADVIRWLIDRGAKPKYDKNFNETPLHLACRHNREQDMTEVVRVLLENFPELVTIATAPLAGQQHILHLIGNFGSLNLVKLVLEYAYDAKLFKWFLTPDYKYAYRTPFDLNVRDFSKYTPLHFAAGSGKDDIVRYLLQYQVEGYELEGLYIDDKTELSDIRVENYIKDKNKVKRIKPVALDVEGLDTKTALHHALEQRNLSIVRLLLEHGADVNHSFDYMMEGESFEKTSPLVFAVSKGDKEMISLLLCHGATDENKALAACFLNSEYKLVEFILTHRAQLDNQHTLIMYQSIADGSVLELKPVFINWKGLVLTTEKIMDNWLCEASLSLNRDVDRSSVISSITRLDISSCSQQQLPLLVFQLPSLVQLDVSSNNISDLPRADHWKLPQLRDIRLDNNRLSSLPSQLFLLDKLEKITVSHNKLKQLPVTIWTSPNMKELNLSNNKLSELPVISSESIDGHGRSTTTLIPDYRRQETLEIREDVFAPPNVRPISKLDNGNHTVNGGNGRNITAVKNRWTEKVVVTPEPYIDPDATLTTLILSHNNFQSVPSGLACLAPKLRKLDLSYNNMTSIGSAALYPTSLTYLNLSYNKIDVQFNALDTSVEACYSYKRANSTPELKTSKHKRASSSGGLLTDSHSRSSSASLASLSSANLLCAHKSHRFDNLTDLNLSDNTKLSTFTFTFEDADFSAQGRRTAEDSLIFPKLSTLDLSKSNISTISTNISKQTQLTQLNLAATQIRELPAQMGLLRNIWSLELRDCPLEGQLETVYKNKTKSSDVIGYLKSILDHAKPYPNMKLMIVGTAGIGKTTLLNKLRDEGRSTKPFSNFTQRRNPNEQISNVGHNGDTISTVGVDISDLIYDKNDRRLNKGKVIFKTWDFGGQEEYYATHQYFLSKRSLYLVVWKVTDGKDRLFASAMKNIEQWLVNIQTRAPDSQVIIVGTHSDLVTKKNGYSDPEGYLREMMDLVRNQFIQIGGVEPSTKGLPQVIDTVLFSSANKHNEVKDLFYKIYDTAWNIRAPGKSQKPLLAQEEPAIYMELEKVVISIAEQRNKDQRDPVLTAQEYRSQVMEKIPIKFRDMDELNQATQFLHDNGVLLHYKDVALSNLYFLNPQWLCDTLAQVISINTVNPFVKDGIMETRNLTQLFSKSRKHQPANLIKYIVDLMSKFEMALHWDDEHLLIPSLLPNRQQDLDEQTAIPLVKSTSIMRRKTVMRSVKSARIDRKHQYSPLGRKTSNTFPRSASNDTQQIGKSTFYNENPVESTDVDNSNPVVVMRKSVTLSHPENKKENLTASMITTMKIQTEVSECMRRLYILSYIPSGFWPRLISHIYRDETLTVLTECLFNIPEHLLKEQPLCRMKLSWQCWKTGLALKYHNGLASCELLIISSLPSENSNCPYFSSELFKYSHERGKEKLETNRMSFIEIQIPSNSLDFTVTSDEELHSFKSKLDVRAQLLTRIVDHVEALLEDWYPDIGARFLADTRGVYLVSRLVPCPECYGSFLPNRGQKSLKRRLAMRGTSVLDQLTKLGQDYVKQASQLGLILCSVLDILVDIHKNNETRCPAHGPIDLKLYAPDTVFADISCILNPHDVSTESPLGKGAFGVVFSGKLLTDGSRRTNVAIKSMQPVDPGKDSPESLRQAYEVDLDKWKREPCREVFRAYSDARQEINILTMINHSNIVVLLGVLLTPISLVLPLAPLGDMHGILESYSKSVVNLPYHVIKQVIIQISDALIYLHAEKIIYRDLKSDNILVWKCPTPHHTSNQNSLVEVKLSDLGVSRAVTNSGAKGNQGTPGFMAPEIIEHKGEEQYSGKVDCFSFGMLIYELLTLKRPYYNADNNNINNCLLAGKYPTFTQDGSSYPTHVLDLMTLCWNVNSLERPSAQQIYDIASYPEFTTLQHAVGSPSDIYVVDSALVTNSTSDSVDLSDVSFNLFVCGGVMRNRHKFGQVEQFTYDQNRFVTAKTLNLEDKCPLIVSCCAVGNHCWLADDKGFLHIYQTVSTSAVINLCDKPVINSTMEFGAITSMIYHDKSKRVYILFNKGFMVEFDSQRMVKRSERKFSSHVSTCFTTVCDSLWVGQRSAYITILPIHNSDNSVSDWMASGECLTQEINHCEPVENYIDTAQIVTDKLERFVWTYVYPGSVVFRWDVTTKRGPIKTDISHTRPSTLYKPENSRLKPGQYQITCLQTTNYHLLAATTWGCIITLNKDSLEILHCVRAHDDKPYFVKSLLNIPGMDEYISVGRGFRDSVSKVMNEKDHIDDKKLWALCWRDCL